MLREYRYWIEQNEQGLVNPLSSPIEDLDDMLTQIQGQWAPEVQRPWLMGLSVRFQTDPRIGAEAHRLYLERVQIVLGIQL